MSSPQLFINNQWVDPKAGGKLDVVDPRTGDVVKQVASAGQCHCEAHCLMTHRRPMRGQEGGRGSSVLCDSMHCHHPTEQHLMRTRGATTND